MSPWAAALVAYIILEAAAGTSAGKLAVGLTWALVAEELITTLAPGASPLSSIIKGIPGATAGVPPEPPTIASGGPTGGTASQGSISVPPNAIPVQGVAGFNPVFIPGVVPGAQG
jgi:hypothetical protein